MAALVAAALAQAGDRTAWLAAILTDRDGRPVRVIVLAALVMLLASGVAAFAGTLIAPLLAPNARQLLLALALALQGGGALFPIRRPVAIESARIGPIPATVTGLTVLAVNDGMLFIVLALAARSNVPALAAIGATIGAVAAIAPAAMMGETAWTALPLRWLRAGIGVAFVVAGVVLALGAVALI